MHERAALNGGIVIVGDVVRSAAEVAGCQEIRFRVYCRERNFLSEADYPEETEQDEFDQNAIHLAVLRHGTQLLGTARIVRYSYRGFPVQRYCHAIFPKSIAWTTGEVSRLAVPRSVTEQYSDARSPICRTRNVSLQLYQAVYRIAKENGLTHLIAAMAPSLVRMCTAFDMPWVPIGPETDYGGLVRPYLLSLAAFDAITTQAAMRFKAPEENKVSAGFHRPS